MYPYPTSGTSIDNVILLFDHSLRLNSKPYIVYMDAGTHFTSHKLCLYFRKKGIALVFVSSTSHKSVGLIKKVKQYITTGIQKNA